LAEFSTSNCLFPAQSSFLMEDLNPPRNGCPIAPKEAPNLPKAVPFVSQTNSFNKLSFI